MENEEIEHKRTKNIVCPYCGYEEYDSFEYDDNDTIECCECEKTYNSRRDIIVTYTTEKIDK